ADTEIELQITGRPGVADDTTAILANVTAVFPQAPGFLLVYDCTQPRPTGSHVNYNPGDIAPNAVLAKLSPAGTICIYTLATTHLIIDLIATIAAPGSDPGTPTPTPTPTPDGEGPRILTTSLGPGVMGEDYWVPLDVQDADWPY